MIGACYGGSPPSLDSLDRVEDRVEGRIRCSDEFKLSMEMAFHGPIRDLRDSTGAACVTSVVN